MGKRNKFKFSRSGHPVSRTTLAPLPSLMGVPEQRLINRTVMKGEWTDPDDLEPNRRRGRVIVGHRGFCPLRWCLRRHKERSTITVEHILAADQLRLLADAIAIGLSGNDRFNLNFIQRAILPRSGPSNAELRQARAWRPFQRAMALFNGDERDLIAHVVLLNLATSRYIVVRRMSGKPTAETTIKPMLISCLDRLVEQFKSEVDRELQRGTAVL
jgi:hypothetical protein